MKVAYVLTVGWGGIPHYTAELANAVSKYADATVLKPKDSNDELFSEDVEVINAFEPMPFSRGNEIKVFSFRNLVNFFSFRNIKLINKIKPDIVHFSGLYPQTSLFTFLYKIYKKYPTINTFHGLHRRPLDQLGTDKNLLGILVSIADFMKYLVKLDAGIVHTRKDKDVLLKSSLNVKSIAVIPHGAYTFLKRYGETETESEGNCILFFGYMGENKGIEYLIKATPFVSEEIPDFKVIIAGEGNFSKYRKFISDKSKFEIYNEFIPNERVSELFQRAKIVVLPYTYHQGHSGVLTIAFSFWKPVIVTNVGDLPNLVKNGKEGLIVPSKDPEALARAIIKLLKDDELRRQMGENAYKKAQELSWDNIAKKHIEVYEEVLEERGVDERR